ncbi:MAG: Ig-like domain repeat protein, partial [Planctomycetes bacterium]|nr:Ig-like domain repeat protein [Planctomycetota bacterium]
MPSTFFWTGNAIAIAGTLVTVNTAVTPNTFKHNALWSNPGNWQSFDSPAGIPQAGDDVVFPAGLDAAHKPPATGSGSTFTWPVNSEIDQNFQINNLTILDDNYHIDFFPGDSFGSPGPNGVPPNTPSTPTLTITGTIRTNIQKTLGSDTGLSLIGPLVPGASNLTIQLASAPGSSPGGLDAQSTGILKIGVPIIEPPVGSTFYVPGQTIGLTKTGPGTMEISGANSFTGLVSVNEGTLLATQSSALGSPSAATVVANGATLGIMQNPRINPITGAPLDPGTFRESFVLSGSGVGGAGALLGTIDPLTTFSGNAFGDTGTATVDGNINLVLPSTSPPTTSTAIGTAGSNVIVNGVVNGNGDLVKLGGGQLTLTNKNAYTGQTLINAGTLEIRNNDALSSSPLSTTTVATGATLQIRGNLIVPENLILNGDGALDLNGNSLGALRLDAAGSQAVWTGTVTLASNASIGVRNSNTPGLNTTLLTITGQVGGAFDLSKVDQGTLRLPNANNNFRGNTFVRNGVLQIASATALGPANVGSINVTNTGNVQGTLQVEGTYTIGKPVTLSGLGFNSGGALRVFENPVGLASNITLSGPITLGTSTSVVVDPVSSLNANGVISGANTASLDKLGLGSLTLAGTNTFLGNLNLREGTTVLTNGRGLGGANGGGTQVFTGASLVLPNPLTVAGEPLTLSGFGVNGQGVLQAPAGTTTWTGPVATAGASVAGVSVTEADINVAQNGVLNFSGVLSGDADLRKLGAGELRLTGSAPNQFTKATFIDVGTVALGKTSGQALRGPIVVGDGQGGDSVDVLRLDASNQIDLDPSLAALNVTPVLVKSSGLFDLNGNNETLGGITSLSLAGGEVRTGAGTLTLGGNLATGGATDTSLFTGTLNLGGTTRALAFSATPAATISSSTIASAVGDPVTFTFTGVANPGLSAPGGTVTFYDGAKIIGSAMLTPVPGMATQSTATLTLTTLTAGNHTIRAEYSGDGNYPPSTVNLIQTQRVFNPPVQENLSSNVNPAGPNQPVTFSYKITGPANTAAPTGTVTFFDTYNGVTSQIGSPQTLDAVGRAAVTTPGLVNTGTHVITARYSGDALYAPSITTLAPNVVGGVVPIVTA